MPYRASGRCTVSALPLDQTHRCDDSRGNGSVMDSVLGRRAATWMLCRQARSATETVRRGTKPVTRPPVSSPGGRLLSSNSDGAFAITSVPSRRGFRQPNEGVSDYVGGP
jgi:hypothetical protein